MALKQVQYIGEGGGGGSGRTLGSVRSTHSRGEVLGDPPPPKKLGI